MKLRKLYRKMKGSALRVLFKLMGKKFVHLLHIGKTGGTAVKHAISESGTVTREFKIELHSHHFRLKDIKKGEGFFFFLRDPMKRFTSGYFSRQRQGKPRYYWPWNEDEKLVFETFTSPDELARGLSSTDPEKRRIAELGMTKIQHIKDSFWDWFGDEDFFRSRVSDLFFIGFQESLNHDFPALRDKFGMPKQVVLPQDDIKAHKNPDSANTELSEEAQKNLRAWYKEDYRFMEICAELIEKDPTLTGPR